MTRVRDKSMGDCVKSGLGTTLCKYEWRPQVYDT